MSTTTAAFKRELIGVPGDAERYSVTAEKIIAYARATNDTIAPHAEGRYAPPVFAVVPAFTSLGPRMAEVIPPEFLMMGVHGEQDFRFHKPIVPGMELETRSVPIGYRAKSSGTTVYVRGETRDQDGDLVVEQFMTSFVRRAQAGEDVGAAPPEHGFPEALGETEPLARVEQAFDADQTYRYSEASGDLVPIHLDDDVARAVGLPGIIIHGLCTMAFTSRAVIETCCPEDPLRLRRLAVRFAKIVQPGQAIATRIWDAGGGTYVFETTADNGTVVIKDGRAELA